MNLFSEILSVVARRFGIQLRAMPDVYNVHGSGATQSGLTDKKGNKRAMMAEFRSWVYACIDARAKEVQGAVFDVFVKQATEKLKPVQMSHPLVRLLNNPNPFMTRSELFYISIAHMDLTGDAFWYTPRNGLGVPAEIWPLIPYRVKIVPSKDKFISHYEVSVGMGETIPIMSDEMVHLRYPNPNDVYYGMAPLMAAAHATDINIFQHEYQRNFYKNYAVPDFAFVTEDRLDEVTWGRMKAEIEDKYGKAENRMVPMLLEGGADFRRIGVSPKEMNWLSENKATMQSIAGIFKVPMHKLGMEDVPNRATAEAADYSFSKGVIEPILGMMDERLTQDLASDFDERLVIKHQSTVKGDVERDARVREVRMRSGYSVNELREMDGQEKVEGGDEILVPSNYVPLAVEGEDENDVAELSREIERLKQMLLESKNGHTEGIKQLIKTLEVQLSRQEPINISVDPKIVVDIPDM